MLVNRSNVMDNPLNMITNQGEDCAPKQCESYVDTLLGNLERRRSRAQLELTNTTNAIDALRANPEVANILELISKAGR